MSKYKDTPENQNSSSSSGELPEGYVATTNKVITKSIDPINRETRTMTSEDNSN